MTTERNHLTPRLGYMASVKFGGMPYPILPGACSPSPWFADLRYTIATPLPHSYPRVQKEVMESKRVTCAVEAEAQNPNLSKPQLRRKLRGFFMDIRATVSRFICKICGYLLFKVFRHLMSHLLVSPQQLKRLTEAEKVISLGFLILTGIPLVYLPLHRSHLDYLLITWTAWHFGLRLPHIASGDNLNLSGLGWLLRSTGAFFIKRPTNVHGNRSRDSLYRAVLHSYIEQLLNKGLSIEFFLEGTRCRFGKSQLPKHGLISNVIQAVQQKAISNCYLVPVSYTYDNIAEGVFLDELIGIPKKRESVFGVLHAVFKSFGKSRRCGAVRLHFGSPVLLSPCENIREVIMAVVGKEGLSRMQHGLLNLQENEDDFAGGDGISVQVDHFPLFLTCLYFILL
uniref:PlsC domain-containing protein n=1 Tax=Angiostrongylus cantonensis TaxID=6313 RepID=A0A158PBV5_ANGCA